MSTLEEIEYLARSMAVESEMRQGSSDDPVGWGIAELSRITATQESELREQHCPGAGSYTEHLQAVARAIVRARAGVREGN